MNRIKAILKRVMNYIIHGVPVINVKAEIAVSGSSDKLKGKNIIITGGGKGLGKAMAKKVAIDGANVLIAGRDEIALQKVSNEIGCQYSVLDVNNPCSFDEFLQDAENKLGGLDILINNAGVSLHENHLFDVCPNGFDIQISTNFRGPYFLTQRFIKRLRETERKGNVIFISSETGDTVDFRPYGFTKAAINSMVQGLAHLYAKDGIRINAISPGVTASEMTGYKSEDNLYCNYNTIGRIYLPEEVAEVVAFLASDFSGCISGQIITCNNAKTVNARWK